MGLGEEGVREGAGGGDAGSVLYSQGLGGGQGWRDSQWETVLRLVANLITPESLSVHWSSPPLITTSNYFTIPPLLPLSL